MSKYQYVLKICYPGESDPTWAIAFGRGGHYQIMNMETKPIHGKVLRGGADLVCLEELVDQKKPPARTVLADAVKRALNGSGR